MSRKPGPLNPETVSPHIIKIGVISYSHEVLVKSSQIP
jgi:hypothetical protein